VASVEGVKEPMAQTEEKTIHVTRRGGKWVVRGSGYGKVFSTHPTQNEAILSGRDLARNNEGELIIHGQDGRVRERDRYNSDPLPPKEPRKVLYPAARSVADKDAIKRAVKEVVRNERVSPSNDPSTVG
jgi:hypothetical protein